MLPLQSLSQVEGSVPIFLVVVAAAVGTGALFLLSLVAFSRRRTTQYLLISVAVGALWIRSVVGSFTVMGVTPMPVHHLIEHGLDLFIAVIVLYAVYAHAPGTLSEEEQY